MAKFFPEWEPTKRDKLADFDDSYQIEHEEKEGPELLGLLVSLIGFKLKLDQCQADCLDEFKQLLKRLEGTGFSSYEKKHETLTRINMLFKRFGVQPVCPKCGEIATLRCRRPGRSKTGVFQFEHQDVNATGKSYMTNHGGSSTFPKFKLASSSKLED